MASIFKVKTDPNQPIKQACLRKKLYTRPLLPIFEIKEVSLVITHDLGEVASFLKTKTDPNQNMKQAYVLKQL